MKTNLVPMELLLKIFGYLEKADLRLCLLVSKSWNKVARSFFDEGLHVEWCEYGKNIAYEFMGNPLCSSKVTKLTLVSSNASYFISGLRCCYNLLILEFATYDPWYLLQRLDNSLVVLPKLQEINVLPQYYVHEKSQRFWSCLWRHKKSITKLTVYRDCPIFSLYVKDLSECLSSFPELQDLEITDMNAELRELLLKGRKLQRLCLKNVDLSFTDGRNMASISSFNNLQKVNIIQSQIHIKALDYMIKVSDKLEQLEVDGSTIVMGQHQDKGELDSILARFPALVQRNLYFKHDNTAERALYHSP